MRAVRLVWFQPPVVRHYVLQLKKDPFRLNVLFDAFLKTFREADIKRRRLLLKS